GRRCLLGPEVESGGTAGAVRAHCERARGLLASGEELERLARGRLRLQLRLYRLGGLAILDSIQRAGFETDRVRPRVSLAAKAAPVLPAGSARLPPAARAPLSRPMAPGAGRDRPRSRPARSSRGCPGPPTPRTLAADPAS